MKRYYGKGVRKAGEMNKTEQRYAALLDERKACGEVVWWGYERINLRILRDAWYRPDFLVQLADNTLEVHEVKGARAVFEAASKLRVKAAADGFPFRVVVAYPVAQKHGGGWEFDVMTKEEE